MTSIISDDICTQTDILYEANIQSKMAGGYSGAQLFEAKRRDGIGVLKVTAYDEKKIAHMAFETAWVNWLSERMDGIVKYIPSKNGKLFETVESNGRKYIFSMQKKAPGCHVTNTGVSCFNNELFENLGELMGRMHNLTENYPQNRPDAEFKWNGPHFWRYGVPIENEQIALREKEMLAQIEELPASCRNYGIVHFDIHTDNFLVDGKKITLIDFDAAQFNWYAADIASALFFMVQKGVPLSKDITEEERTDFAKRFLCHHLKGYRKHRDISADWMNRFELFMRYQMIDEYFAALHEWKNNPNSETKWYLDWFVNRIVDRKPYVSIEYGNI